MINDLVVALEDVRDNPVMEVLRYEWLWRTATDDIIAGCPLTQVAIKTGIDVPGLLQEYAQGSYILDHLHAHFQVERWLLIEFYQGYDSGSSLDELISSLKAVQE